MSIKQMIIKLCDDMIVFWTKLKEDVEVIPDEDNCEIINKWYGHFEDNSEFVGELSDVKRYIEIYPILPGREMED